MEMDVEGGRMKRREWRMEREEGIGICLVLD